jgi:uncharacterized repeat protein (TIGR03806 family)
MDSNRDPLRVAWTDSTGIIQDRGAALKAENSFQRLDIISGMSLKHGSLLSTLLFCLSLASESLIAGDTDTTSPPPRALWTTSRVVGSPEPPHPYRIETKFRKLSIKQPIGFYPEPGTGRVLIVQHLGNWTGPGTILAIDDSEDADKVDRLLHHEEIIFALEFHPEYEKNGHVFISTSSLPHLPVKTSTVSRFTVSRHSPYDIDPSSRVVIVDWSSELGGHIGGGVAFGNDGFLYISVGDGGSEGDEYQHAQNLGTLHGSVIRIDVLHPSGGKPYSIPKDNPFVRTPGARPEIWAYGLRNPWRMSFDKKTNRLWVGSNGQDNWEQVYAIRKGANYGWSIMEGAYPYNLNNARGPTPISGPVIDHPHSEARSLTGGLVYHGRALPDLRGAYVYGDWATGKIWALRLDEERITYQEEIADTTLKIGSFGVDHDGELVVLDQNEGGIYRLVPTDAQDETESFPRSLSATGLFASVEKHELHPGLLPYEVNVAQFSGGARAERAIALPGDATMEFTPKGSWGFSDGTVLIKTLSMPTTSSDRNRWQRIETQMLHRRAGEWEAYSYQWNEDGTDAVLVDRKGAQTRLEIRDKNYPGERRQYTWEFRARAECMMCHSRAAGFVLGVSSPQLQRTVQRDGKPAQQIQRFERLGLLEFDEGESSNNIAVLVDPHDPSHDLELRARSYLHGACSHCHRQDGGGNARVHLHIGDALDETRLINEPASHGTFALSDAKIIAPGNPDRSVLCYRLSTMGGARMPRLGSTEIDTRALALIREWIESMPGEPVDEQRPQAEALRRLRQATTPDDEVRKIIGGILDSTSASLALTRVIESGKLLASVKHAILELATVHEKATTRDLFERFIPEERRKKRLGDRIDAETILALTGSVERGRRLYEEGTTAQCKSCHVFGNGPQRMGPDLEKIGAKLKRAELLDSILTPSRKIDPEFLGYLVLMNTGETHTGTIVRPNDEEIVVRTAAQEEARLPRDNVLDLVAQEISLMPTGLAGAMTAQELADLLAFLENAN